MTNFLEKMTKLHTFDTDWSNMPFSQIWGPICLLNTLFRITYPGIWTTSKTKYEMIYINNQVLSTNYRCPFIVTNTPFWKLLIYTILLLFIFENTVHICCFNLYLLIILSFKNTIFSSLLLLLQGDWWNRMSPLFICKIKQHDSIKMSFWISIGELINLCFSSSFLVSISLVYVS